MQEQIKKFWQISAILLIFIYPKLVYSHGDLHLRIQEISSQIKDAPDSTYLYLKRGILYFQHEEYKESLADLNHCEESNYSDKLLDLTFAKVYYKIEKFDHSLKHLKKILKRDTDNVLAWRIQGQVLFEMKKYKEAASAYENVIKKAIRTLPSNYLDASICYELMDSNSSKLESITVVQRGLEDLGPLMTFHGRLVELGIKYKNFNLAIEHQNSIIELSNRKEKPLYERSLIYIKKGDKKMAKNDLLLAREAFDQLPIRQKSTKAMIELSTKINIQIESL